MICDACGGSGCVIRPRDGRGRERPLREWFTFCVPCRGSGATPNEYAFIPRAPAPNGKPYERVNQIDWYGTLWSAATFVYSGCASWDSRDGFELAVADRARLEAEGKVAP